MIIYKKIILNCHLQNIQKYRRSYKGAVVTTNRLNYHEWMVFLGDSAHSVLPATGEGVNSALEDAEVLVDALLAVGSSFSSCSKSSSSSDALLPIDLSNALWFNRFNDMRIKDVKGLSAIACYLNSSDSLRAPEKISRVVFMIFQAILKSVGIFKFTYEDLTFGPKAVERIPYGDVASLLEGRKSYMLPIRY